MGSKAAAKRDEEDGWDESEAVKADSKDWWKERRIKGQAEWAG